MKLLPNAEINKKVKQKVVTVVIGAKEQEIMDKLLQRKELNDHNIQQLQTATNGI